MQRIMIMGSGGSGKSALAKQLGEISGLPVVHLDKIVLLPNWKLKSKEQTVPLIIEEQDKERWIIDGTSPATMAHRMERADVIILIDFKLCLCYYRGIKRSIKNYGKVRDEVGEGCRDKITWFFLKCIWNFRKRRQHIIKMMNASGKTVYHLKTRKQVREFVEEMKEWFV